MLELGPAGPLALVVAGVAGGVVLRAGGAPYVGSVSVVVGLAAAVTIAVAHPRARHLTPAVAPLVIAAVVGMVAQQDRVLLRTRAWGDPGMVDRCAVLAGAGVLMTALLAAGVDVRRLVARCVGAAATALSSVVSSLVFGVLVVPAWALGRLRPGHPLRGRRKGPAWLVPRSSTGGREASLAAGPSTASAAHRSIGGRLVGAVGCVVVVMAANFGVGWAWDAAHAEPARGGLGRVPWRSLGPVARDPRNDAPAMAAYPWRERYFDDMQRPVSTYWPYTELRPRDFRSPYINIEGWARRSHTPADLPADAPTVWMFGGSTTWGEGQRDEYTIPSWLSRLAEDAGVPIRVTNYGQRGWTHFQEMVLYEQLLAAEGAPDLTVFYDGANEPSTQSLLDEAVPTHTLAYGFAQKLLGSSIATEFLAKPPPDDPWGAAWDAYVEHSAVHKLVRWAGGQPAGAQETAPDDDPYSEGIETDEFGLVQEYDITDEDCRDAGIVYERGKRITRFLSQEHGVEPLFFWQPVKFVFGCYERAIEQLTDSTIDISDALLDHHDVYIDGSHTNEEGARIVAERIWEHLRPRVEARYAGR